MDKVKFLYGLENEQKDVLTKVFDKAMQSLKHDRTYFSDFCTPIDLKEITMRKKHLPNVVMSEFGGYEDAERKIIAFSNESDREFDFPITVLEIKGRDMESLTHRDYLGSIMSSGISRDKVGDVVLNDSGAIVFLKEDIAEYIKNNLSSIGGKSIESAVKNLDEVVIPEKRFEEITGTAASVRLDAVLTVLLNTSRSKATEFINAKRVFVNQIICTKNDMLMKEGDIITVRGKCKSVLEKIGNVSKKGRIFLTIKKYK